MLRVLALSMLAACGGSYCEQSASWAEDCGGTVSDAEVESCEAALEPCSGSDQKHLIDAMECLQDAGGFGVCGDDDDAASTTPTTGELEALAAELAACNEIYLEVSAACLEAAMGGTDDDGSSSSFRGPA